MTDFPRSPLGGCRPLAVPLLSTLILFVLPYLTTGQVAVNVSYPNTNITGLDVPYVAMEECPPSDGCLPPGGCPDTVMKAEAAKQTPPMVLDESANTMLIYIGWPGSVLLCSAIALGALLRKEDRETPLRRRIVSIRFCNQAIMSLIVFISSATMFFVSFNILKESVNLTFEHSEKSSQQAFLNADRNINHLSTRLFRTVSGSAKEEITKYFDFFLMGHNATISFVKEFNVDIETETGRANMNRMMMALVRSSTHLRNTMVSFDLTFPDPDTVVDGVHDKCQKGTRAPCGNPQVGYVEGTAYILIPWMTAQVFPQVQVATKLGYHTDAIGVGYILDGPQWRTKKETFGHYESVVFNSTGHPVRVGCQEPKPCCEADEFSMLPPPKYFPQLSPESRARPSRDWGHIYANEPLAGCGFCPCSTDSATCSRDPIKFTGCRIPMALTFRKLDFYKPQWSKMWSNVGQLLIDVNTVVPTKSGKMASVSHTMSLRLLAHALADLLQFPRQALYIVTSGPDGHIMVTTTGAPFINVPGSPFVQPIRAVDSDSYIVRQSARNFTMYKDNSSSPSFDGSDKKVDEVRRFVDEETKIPYFYLATRVHLLSTFEATIVNVVPLYDIESDIVESNLQLQCNMTSSLEEVQRLISNGVASIILTSIVLICLSSATVFIVNKYIQAPLAALMADMQDVSKLRLARVQRRHENKRPSRYLEINKMEQYFMVMVSHLAEMRRYLPDTVMSGDADGSTTGTDTSLLETQEELFEEDNPSSITVKIRARYYSRQAMRKHFGRLDMNDVAMSGSSSALKRTVAFQHTYMEGRPNLVTLMRELRTHLGERPLEPLCVFAVVRDHSDQKTEILGINDNTQLAGCLAVCQDSLDLVIRKSSSKDYLPILVAVVTLVDLISTVVYALMDISIGKTLGLLSLLVIAIGCNLYFSFELNKKMARDPLVKEWMEASQMETTFCLVISAVSLQNLQILYSGIRFGSFLRFHAPVQTPMRHQIIKTSVVSLIGIDILPTIVTTFITLREGIGVIGIISIAMGGLAAFCSAIKKLVVFCFVDDRAKKKDFLQSAAVMERKERERSILRQKEITVLRVQLNGFEQLLDLALAGQLAAQKSEGKVLSAICTAFYEHCFRYVKRGQGTVIYFDSCTLEAVFNAPKTLAGHPASAVTAALHITEFRVDPSLLPEHTHIPLTAVVGVATDYFYIGNIGTTTRKAFNRLGKCNEMSRNLCSMNEGLKTRILVNQTCQEQMEDFGTSNYVTRKIDVTLDKNGNWVTAYEVCYLADMDQKAISEWKWKVQTYHLAFDALEEGDIPQALSTLDEYLSSQPRPDPPAQELRSRLSKAIAKAPPGTKPGLRDVMRRGSFESMGGRRSSMERSPIDRSPPEDGTPSASYTLPPSVSDVERPRRGSAALRRGKTFSNGQDRSVVPIPMRHAATPRSGPSKPPPWQQSTPKTFSPGTPPNEDFFRTGSFVDENVGIVNDGVYASILDQKAGGPFMSFSDRHQLDVPKKQKKLEYKPPESPNSRRGSRSHGSFPIKSMLTPLVNHPSERDRRKSVKGGFFPRKKSHSQEPESYYPRIEDSGLQILSPVDGSFHQDSESKSTPREGRNTLLAHAMGYYDELNESKRNPLSPSSQASRPHTLGSRRVSKLKV